MAQIGTFVTDPKLGAYCRIKLEDGKVLLNHDRASLDSGIVTITEVKWMGLGAGETLLTCDLGSLEGQAVSAAHARRGVGELGGHAPRGVCRAPEALPDGRRCPWAVSRSAEAGAIRLGRGGSLGSILQAGAAAGGGRRVLEETASVGAA
jgi:hypothetical protein